MMKRSLARRIEGGMVQGYYHHRRWFASRAQKGAWSSLSSSEQAAWRLLHYTPDSWEGRRYPPAWKPWSGLTLEEKAAAMHGLNIPTKDAWDASAPATQNPSSATTTAKYASSAIPPLSSLLQPQEEDDNDTTHTTTKALMIAQETRTKRQQQAGGGLGNLVYQTVKGLAPIVGPLIRSVGNHPSRGGGRGLALSLVGTLIEQLPTILDASSGVLEVTGIETLIYLDDSGSMQGSNLIEGQKALSSLEQRLKKNTNDHHDVRFLPTRIVKFGQYATVLNPSEEDWSVALVNTAWDGSSGGTYMWKMIQEDIRAKYRPAGGKLRIVVITDGYDTLSPPPYRGVRGCNPLMQTLLQAGFDIEWNIIVVGNNNNRSMRNLFQPQQPELSRRDQDLYQSLCHATGGHFLSVSAQGWQEDDRHVEEFLDAMEDSGYEDSEEDRRHRQTQYQLEVKRGKAENFEWLPSLVLDKDDNNNKDKKKK